MEAGAETSGDGEVKADSLDCNKVNVVGGLLPNVLHATRYTHALTDTLSICICLLTCSNGFGRWSQVSSGFADEQIFDALMQCWPYQRPRRWSVRTACDYLKMSGWYMSFSFSVFFVLTVMYRVFLRAWLTCTYNHVVGML